MQHRDEIILQKIISEIEKSFIFFGDNTLEDFLDNEILQYAVGMISINIGELVKNLSDDFRKNNSQVAWKSAAQFRDIVAHKYETLRMVDVYKTVKEDFPELKKQIEEILENEQKSVRGGKNVDD